MTFSATSPEDITYTGNGDVHRWNRRFRHARGTGTITCTTTDGGAHKAVHRRSPSSQGCDRQWHTGSSCTCSRDRPLADGAAHARHKGLEHNTVHVIVGPHAFSMLGRGFETMAVPALKLDGRRVQGSRVDRARAGGARAASRRCSRPIPERGGGQQAEAGARSCRIAARRLVLCAARRDAGAFHERLSPPQRAASAAQHSDAPARHAAGHRRPSRDRRAGEETSPGCRAAGSGRRVDRRRPARQSPAQRRRLPDRAEHRAAAAIRRSRAVDRTPSGRGLAQRVAPDASRSDPAASCRDAWLRRDAQAAACRPSRARWARSRCCDRPPAIAPGRWRARTLRPCPRGAMNDDARVHLEVALELDGHSIRGTVSDGVSPRASSAAGWS